MAWILVSVKGKGGLICTISKDGEVLILAVKSPSKHCSKGRNCKGKKDMFDSIYVTRHIQMTKYILTNNLSGNRFAVSYCSL